jgi:hypothetical protein
MGGTHVLKLRTLKFDFVVGASGVARIHRVWDRWDGAPYRGDDREGRTP